MGKERKTEGFGGGQMRKNTTVGMNRRERESSNLFLPPLCLRVSVQEIIAGDGGAQKKKKKLRLKGGKRKRKKITGWQRGEDTEKTEASLITFLKNSLCIFCQCRIQRKRGRMRSF